MIGRRAFFVCGSSALAFGGLWSPAALAEGGRPVRLSARLILPPTIGRARAFFAAPAVLFGLQAPFDAGCVRGNADEITTLADGSGVLASWRAGAVGARLEAEQTVTGPPIDVASLLHVGVGWVETPSGRRSLSGGAISFSAAPA